MARPLGTEQVRVGRQGRVVIPAALRRSLRIVAGDRLVAAVDKGGRLVFEKREASLRRLQARFRKIPATVDLAGELIRDRTAEVRRERRR